MRINHNISALNTFGQLSKNEAAQAKTTQQLSSGKRINSAADDAAGLSISEKMKAQIRGLDQASRNSQDGISMIQTADGSLSTANDILARIKELATQAANGTYDASTDLTNVQKEVDQLATQFTDIKTNTKFNGTALLDGQNDVKLQIGTDSTQTLTIAKASTDLSAVDTAVSGYDLSTQGGATTALADIDTQINAVNGIRSYLGANQNQLEKNISNLDTTSENLTSAQSRIEDVDMAKAVMENSKNGILAQAAQAMLAQANQQPQGVLQLLR
jgi:flagellin